MEPNVNNLIFKNIKDFTQEDTIYLTGGTSDFPITYLCSFVKIENNKITGKKIKAMVNADLYEREVGEEITVNISKASLFGQHPDEKRTRYHSFDFLGFAGYEKNFNKEDAEMPKEHPSYATVRFTRVNGGNSSFFGASIKPNNYISLEISTATINRDLSHDWIHSRKQIIELAMTEHQFAELITSLNIGSGTPATIKYMGLNRVPDPPFMGKYEQFSKEFKNEMNEMSYDLELDFNRIKTLLDSDKPIGKKDRANLIGLISSYLSKAKSSIPFYEKSFNEQMNKTVTEAKLEIEQFLQQRAKKLGIDNVEKKQILGIGQDDDINQNE